MTDDVFFTISAEGQAQFREKMSRFLSFAFHVSTAEEARDIVKNYQNLYHDSRHVCWAYRLGPEGEEWQLNDNGEPSGTAGKPILGQIRSKELTDVLVVVVRYFGGIKLGTPGLIAAYRQAAALALDDAPRLECHSSTSIAIQFPYMAADKVMKLVKADGIMVTDRQFDNLCTLKADVWNSILEELKGRLSKVEGLVFV
ncbi:MAG: YigZ family protein [Clostridium sp.]|nr:YigZ family protein [Prevotella sp.]MCM1429461.1 YigZ family protein [Clostridium sp.]MCM1475504.1 YigZ family protein [Muribaculaceae bacterium]